MRLDELLKKYCFHDSLLESIAYNEQLKTAVFEIDFCNWAQENYTDAQPETMMISLHFREVKSINNYSVYLDSSTISDCKIINTENGDGIEFVVCRDYPDGDGGVDVVQVIASSVEFIIPD